MRHFIRLFVAIILCTSCSGMTVADTDEQDSTMTKWRQQSAEFWKQRLTDHQYKICREGGTEKPFTGQYNDFKDKGTFTCSSCGHRLFSSKTKYDSKTGWPSFWDPIQSGNVELHDDYSWLMHRIELKCSRCGAHLGHVFNDGPKPTGKRYCINSACLKFVPE